MSQWWHKNSHGKSAWQKGSGKQWWEYNSDGGWDCQAPKCVGECRKLGRGPWHNPKGCTGCQACGGTKPAANQGQSTLQLLKTALGSTSPPNNGPKRTYAQAAAPASLAAGTAAAATIEVPVPSDEVDSFDISTVSDDVTPMTSLALPEEFVAIARLLQAPREMATEWSAEAELEKRMPQKGKVNTSVAMEELADLKALLALQEKKKASGLPAATEKRIEFAAKKLAKLEDSAVNSPPSAAQLEWAREQAETSETTRVSRTDASSVNAESRANRLEEICKEQMAAWEAHLVTIQTERRDRDAAWQARRLLLEGRALEVEELAREKIAEAKERAGNMDESEAAVEPPETQSKLERAIAELAQQKKDAAAEREALLQRLSALEKSMAAANTAPAASSLADNVPTTGTVGPEAPARLQDSVYRQCSLAVVYTVEELPVLKAAPDKEQRFKLALIQANLAHWAQAGMIPATFCNLVQGCKTEESPDVIATMKELVGEQIWERFFKGTDVEVTQYVPFQLGSIMNTAIARAEAVFKKYSKEWDFAAKAKDHFLALLQEDDEAKREGTGRYARRPGPY